MLRWIVVAVAFAAVAGWGIRERAGRLAAEARIGAFQRPWIVRGDGAPPSDGALIAFVDAGIEAGRLQRTLLELAREVGPLSPDGTDHLPEPEGVRAFKGEILGPIRSGAWSVDLPPLGDAPGGRVDYFEGRVLAREGATLREIVRDGLVPAGDRMAADLRRLAALLEEAR